MSEIGLIGTKIGMTQESFTKLVNQYHVTVLKVEKGRVLEIIEKEKRGYKAVQIGLEKLKIQN